MPTKQSIFLQGRATMDCDLHGAVASFVDPRELLETRDLGTPEIGLFPRSPQRSAKLRCATLDDALVTSFFVVIDTRRSRMFLDLSYAQVETIFPTRFAIRGDSFSLRSTPVVLEGEYIVLGGPVDTVWYHWLFNWCPRLTVLDMLRPDLLARPDIKILVHPLALVPPYRDILATFNIAAERFVVADPAADYLLERAHLVSFLDQRKLYPDIIRRFAEHLRHSFSLQETSYPGLFASRQPLPPPKRRIANFEAIEPILRKHELSVVALGQLPARVQAALFHAADIVVGGHGSDLSNLLFCRPGTPVVVIENEASVMHDLHAGLEQLAEVLGLPYHLLVSPTTHEPHHGMSVSAWQARDYVVDPQALDMMIGKAKAASIPRRVSAPQ